MSRLLQVREVFEQQQFQQAGMNLPVYTSPGTHVILGCILKPKTHCHMQLSVLLAIKVCYSLYPVSWAIGNLKQIQLPCNPLSKSVLFHTWSTEHRRMRIMQRNRYKVL